jgi:hypothetical protein
VFQVNFSRIYIWVRVDLHLHMVDTSNSFYSFPKYDFNHTVIAIFYFFDQAYFKDLKHT